MTVAISHRRSAGRPDLYLVPPLDADGPSGGDDIGDPDDVRVPRQRGTVSPMSDRPVIERPAFDRPDSDRLMSDRPTPDRWMSDRSMPDRWMSDRSVSDRSVSDRSVSDRSVSDRSVSDRSVSARGHRSIRLTRRGRVVVGMLLLGVAVALTMLLAPATHAAPSGPDRAVVVHPGDTLWSIATAALPSEDPYQAVDQVRVLNHLPDNRIYVGEQIVLPPA